MLSKTNEVNDNRDQHIQLMSMALGVAAVTVTLIALSRMVSGANAYELLAFGTIASASGLARLRIDVKALAGAPPMWADAVIVIASAPYLGVLAWAPAVLATLARLASQDTDHSLRHTLAELSASCAAGVAAGAVYLSVAGQVAGSTSSVSLWGIVPAALAFTAVRFAPTIMASKRHAERRSELWTLAMVAAGGVLTTLWIQACPRNLMILTGILLLLAYAAKTIVTRQASTSQVQPLVASDSEQEQSDSWRPAMIDPLTGLANDRYLYMFLRQEIGRSSRKNVPLSLLLLDIDGFEAINGRYGKDSADAALKEMAGMVKTLIRDYDLAARCSSDEIAVVLPEASGSDALDTADRIRQHISNSSFRDSIKLQVSVGVATYQEHGATPDNLMSSAHHALNRAKFSGKNRVIGCTEIADNLKYGT